MAATPRSLRRGGNRLERGGAGRLVRALRGQLRKDARSYSQSLRLKMR
jgi:hypothetical protein